MHLTQSVTPGHGEPALSIASLEIAAKAAHTQNIAVGTPPA
jgi:hypothetical protein